MTPLRVLFVCIHNSARSQMAEAFLRFHCPDQFEAHSAGIDGGTLNPVVVEAMHLRGIDISGARAKPIAEYTAAGTAFRYVITVCDETSAERCPVFPFGTERLHWSFPDPSAFAGTQEERLARTIEVRDAIEARIVAWCAEQCGARA